MRVAVDGTKTWIVYYSVKGKSREYTLKAPWGITSDDAHISLADARKEAEFIRRLASEGLDFRDKREEERAKTTKKIEEETLLNKTVRDLFEDWITTVRRKDDGKELRHSMERDVMPTLADIRLREIVEKDIRDALAPIVAMGKNRTVVIRLENLKQMFQWGAARRPWKALIEDDPTALLKNSAITSPDYSDVERDRALSRSEVVELRDKLSVARLPKKSVNAIWIMLSCCTRIGETTKALWKDIDLENRRWYIPKENSKNGRDHIVYLSDFAERQFERQKFDYPNSIYVFPNTTNGAPVQKRTMTRLIRERQDLSEKRKKIPYSNYEPKSNVLMLSGGEWTPHDLRRTGATLMQSLGIMPEVIERVLNHTEQNRVKRIYQRHDYADEMRQAWGALGKLLTELVDKP